jgi:hypothetical protein
MALLDGTAIADSALCPRCRATGYQPWHATGYANAALRLLGHRARFNNTVYRAIAQNSSLWRATLDPLLHAEYGGPRRRGSARIAWRWGRGNVRKRLSSVSLPATHPCLTRNRPVVLHSSPLSRIVSNVGCSSIWDCGHKIAAIPAVLAMEGASAEAAGFMEWWLAYLGSLVDDHTGQWLARSQWAPPAVEGLGGAFHIYFVFNWLRQVNLRPRAMLLPCRAVGMAPRPLRAPFLFPRPGPSRPHP